MDTAKAESEVKYRIAMAVVTGLRDQGILTGDETKQAKNLLIDLLQPFIGRLECD